MRTLLLISFLISTLASSQIKWMSIEDAIKAQKTQPKKILIDFYADWCGPCKTMEKYTYNHPVIAEYLNENYYIVKFDAEGKEKINIYGHTFGNDKKGKNNLHDFTKYMNVNAVPSIVFLDEKGNPITILQGALSAKELEPYLPFFANDMYLKLRTKSDWENYQKKFKSKIKN
ncbi:MAG: thioredoxin fold domain-containing protein [Cruoricaptor ignavus]|nr:thioredoxin fold domain-containing protein [Cruoricaptor ignavus]